MIILFQAKPGHVWCGVFDAELNSMVEVKTGDDALGVLAQMLSIHPDLPVYTVDSMDPKNKMALNEYNRRVRVVMDSIAKSW